MRADRVVSLADGRGRALRRGLGLAFAALLAVTLLSVGHSFLTHDPVGRAAAETEGTVDANETTERASGGPLVVATVDGVGPGQIVAYDANGSVVYHNESWWIYHDVDPSPRGERTVTYVASGTASEDTCSGEACLRNAIERVNLTTGNVTRIHAWTVARNGSSQTHDVDRVNESVVLVADISYPDRVYMVNVTSGEVIWEWRVSEAYGPESGGSYPSDWTHLNDVEYLDDGRVMVSLRNQDQVVFVEPGAGLQEDWTLGSDDDHEILYEAHNPDYIPEERGGPAVVIADSENNRLVEYQRVDGEWERTWRWRDVTLQWPRDADRLPSGRTLVVDSHGQRILSVRQNGSVAWSHEFPTGGYDVEVVGTGDESAGGESAAALGLVSRRPGTVEGDGDTTMRGSVVGPSVGGPGVSRRPGAATPTAEESNATDSGGLDPVSGVERGPDLGVDLLVYGLVSLVPPLVLHGLLYALPTWVGAVDATLLLATAVVGGAWATATVGARLLAYRARGGR